MDWLPWIIGGIVGAIVVLAAASFLTLGVLRRNGGLFITPTVSPTPLLTETPLIVPTADALDLSPLVAMILLSVLRQIILSSLTH